MKKLVCLQLLLLCILHTYSQPGGTRRALLIAIGNYPPNGWAYLNSVRDTAFIKPALRGQGFAEANIKVLTDDKATIAGIDAAFEQLIASTKPGDVLFVQFSAHGEQIEDDNHDEPDCLDESIVTYQAILPDRANPKDYDINQQQFLRDDKIGAYVNRLRKKAGKTGDLVVSLDVCHSGTGTRFRGHVRGDQPPLVSASFHGCNYNGLDSNLIMDSTAIANDPDIASYVVISASRAEEVDAEVENPNRELVGALTYALCRAFATLGSDVTYNSFFSRVESDIASLNPGQHAVLEGNGGNRLLWGGRYLHSSRHFEIDHFPAPNKAQIKAGTLAGLDSGATIAIYPFNTIDTSKSKPLATGKVITADLYSCTVQFDLQRSPKPAGWVFLVLPVYNQKPVNIFLAGYAQAQEKTIKTLFKEWPLVKFDNTPALIIAKGNAFDSLIIASTGLLFCKIPSAVTHPDSLKEAVNRYLQYSFLAGLVMTDSTVTPEIRLVRWRHHTFDPTFTDVKVNGVYDLTDQDSVLVWVRNKGNIPIYINLLDLSTDGNIYPIFPNRQIDPPIDPGDLVIMPHQDRLFKSFIISFGEPFGTDVYKLFASKQPLDLEYLANAKGSAPLKGNFSILEKLFNHSYELGYQAKSAVKGRAEGSISTIIVQVKPLKP